MPSTRGRPGQTRSDCCKLRRHRYFRLRTRAKQRPNGSFAVRCATPMYRRSSCTHWGSSSIRPTLRSVTRCVTSRHSPCVHLQHLWPGLLGRVTVRRWQLTQRASCALCSARASGACGDACQAARPQQLRVHGRLGDHPKVCSALRCDTPCKLHDALGMIAVARPSALVCPKPPATRAACCAVVAPYTAQARQPARLVLQSVRDLAGRYRGRSVPARSGRL